MASSVLWLMCAVLLIFSDLLLVEVSNGQKLDGPEHHLYIHLFSDYTPESRPVKNASHTVQVTFALSLNQLLDLDEKNQILSTSVWIYEEWKDEMLQWSPSDYDGQTAIMIPADSVWLPDIFIFNRAGANMGGFVNVNGSKVSVQHDGTVRWMVPLMVSSVCAVDVTYFPYDQQTCSIKFGSWIYDIDQVDIVNQSAIPDLEHYVMNSEYDLRNVSLSRDVMDSSCCAGGGRHSMVELRLQLRRKSLYYDYIVIAPTIMLCVLTLASFLLPCDRGEKMAIGLTVFLTLYVLQLRIADNVPDTNSTPILGVFMLIVMTFNCVSLIMATIVMNIKKRGDDCPCPAVPTWLFAVCHHFIGKVVCTTYFGSEPIVLPAFPTYSEQSRDHLVGAISPAADISEGQSCSGTSSVDAQHSCTGDSTSRRGRIKDNKPGKCKNVTTSDDATSHQAPPQHAPPQHAPPHQAPPQHTPPQHAPPHQTPPQHAPPQRQCYDPHKTPHPHSEGEVEMRLRKSAKEGSSVTSRNSSHEISGPLNEMSQDNVYMMKRRWFYVAEVVDKFLFLVYLVLLTTSIFTVLFLIPVYFRKD